MAVVTLLFSLRQEEKVKTDDTLKIIWKSFSHQLIFYIKINILFYLHAKDFIFSREEKNELKFVVRIKSDCDSLSESMMGYYFVWETICLVIDLISVFKITSKCMLCSHTKSLHSIHWYCDHHSRVLHLKRKFPYLCCRSFVSIIKNSVSSTRLSFKKISHKEILYQFSQDDIESMTQVFEVCNSSFVHIYLTVNC